MPQNIITLQQAQTWAQTWRNSPDPSIIAFLIPGIDVTEVLAETYTVNVRSYLGIDENKNPKLMIVGVDASGKDLIDDTKGQYIYDFTSGCRPDCDNSSPLFNL